MRTNTGYSSGEDGGSKDVYQFIAEV